MRLVLILLATLAAILPAASRAATFDEIVLADGRRYLIAVPPGVDNPPLILALHGGGGSPEQFSRDSGLPDKALARGYAIAFPAGTSRRGRNLLVWNGGYCCGYAPAAGVDDVAFLLRVIDDAGRRFGADRSRVFLTGMSNGALMAQTLASVAPRGTVRAVASVAGTMDVSRYRPRQAIPLLHIHGTLDRHVPYSGGTGPDSFVKVDFTPAEAVIEAFCAADPGPLKRSETRIDTARDGMHVERIAWSRAGTPRVVLLRVVGGDHDWPGGRRAARRGATRDIDANREALDFFDLYR